MYERLAYLLVLSVVISAAVKAELIPSDLDLSMQDEASETALSQISQEISPRPVYDVIYEEKFGTWLEPVSAMENYFACGAALKMDQVQPEGKDDIGATALRLVYCNRDDWNQQNQIDANANNIGDYRYPAMFPPNLYINGALVVFQSLNSIDNTAINGLRIKCSHPTVKSLTWVIGAGNGNFGDKQTNMVANDWGFVCGAQVKYDSTQRGNDATGLNGIAFKYCKIEYSLEGYKLISEGLKGDWLTPIQGPTDYYACGMSIKSQYYEENKDNAIGHGVILLYCKYGSWDKPKISTLYDGNLGEWKDARMCPEDTYIHGASIKLDTNLSGDNNGINGIKFKCKSPKPGSKSTEVMAEYGKFGSWSDYVELDEFVCGGQARFDFNRINDATGLNGLRLKFCSYAFRVPKYDLATKKYFGGWHKPIDAPAG